MKDSKVRDVPPKGERYRLLTIGDSFTEGVGFPFEKTFSGIVSSHLKERTVEVLNAGVSSYSPVIYYRKIRHLYEEMGVRFDEVALFLDISDIKDEITDYRLVDDAVVPRHRDGAKLFLYRQAKMLQSFLKESSMIYLMGLQLSQMGNSGDELNNSCSERLSEAGGDMRAMDSSFVADFIFTDLRGNWTFDEADYTAWGEKGLHESATNMTRLADFLEEKKIRLTLVVYPWPHQIFKRDLDSIQVSFWSHWTAERGVPFINLFPDFINEEAPLETYAHYFIPCDMHWNEEGHQKVAEGFLRRFVVNRDPEL